MANKAEAPKEERSPKVEESPANMITDISQDAPINKEALMASWKSYAKTIEKSNIRLFSILMNHPPEIVKGNKLVVKLSNSTQETEVKNEKSKLFQHLRSELKINNIYLDIEISQADEGEQRAYTASDKYKVMLQKNPALGELKRKFGLELE